MLDQFPTGFLTILGIIVIVVGVIGILRRFLATTGERLPYRLRDSLLTPNERSFYGVLQQVADDLELQVFAKVRLSDVLWIPRGTDNWILHRNRIQQKHMDFVLCDRQDIAPVLAIELDDSSHRRADRQERDSFVERACAVAGLPLLRISTRNGYAPRQLAEDIRARLDGMRPSNQSSDVAADAPSTEPYSAPARATSARATSSWPSPPNGRVRAGGLGEA